MSLPVRERGLKCDVPLFPPLRDVAPRAGAWVEMSKEGLYADAACVAPRAGAWVEISEEFQADIVYDVAPRAGAWVEIMSAGNSGCSRKVAPRAGTWVEMHPNCQALFRILSLPVRERGLKWLVCPSPAVEADASLPVRERGLKLRERGAYEKRPSCRSPCGSVG